MSNISKMKSRELERVMHIWYRETLIAHGFIKVGYWDRVSDIIRREYIEAVDIYVYKMEEKIIGFISILNEEFIGGIFVEQENQNKGIGTKLINFAKENQEKLLLRVYKKNSKAIKFYNDNGFIIINERENMENREREHIMMWRK